MKQTPKIFEPHRFPVVWCALIVLHLAILSVAIGLYQVWCLGPSILAIFAFATWTEDLEAARHSRIKKNIISFLIVASALLTTVLFILAGNNVIAPAGLFGLVIAIHFVYFIAIMAEKDLHKK